MTDAPTRHPLLSYVVALHNAAEQINLRLRDKVHSITVTSVGNDGIEVDIAADPSLPMAFLGVFLADLLSLHEKCGDTASTDQVEMTAQGRRKNRSIHTKLHMPDPEQAQEAMGWLNTTLGDTAH